MDPKLKKILIGSITVFLIAILIIIIILINKFSPNKETITKNEYFEAVDGQATIILQDERYDKKAIIIDDEIYIDYDTVITYFNKRFYWDANENVLIYTTPTEVIKAQVSSKDYYINKSKSSMNCDIVKTDGENTYIAISYINKFSDIEYTVYDNPSRIVINYQWGVDLYGNIKKDTKVRNEGNIKAPILDELNKEQSIQILEQDNKWAKIITDDGIIGYIQSKHLKSIHEVQNKSNYVAPVYTSIQKDYKICLVWHQVTNQDANAGLSNLILQTKGVNTVSPTWYSIEDEEGRISSLVSENYIKEAHRLGLEVWALINDFNKDVNMFNVLSHTSKRERLVNELIAEAIKYNINGINIDFENIGKDTGIHYIQFIRELSVKCRNNGVILSIDNYVPMPYNMYYDRTEQGIVADYVIIMGYDEHYAGSEESGPVASLGFVESGITGTIEQVPANKVINGIPFYTRLWIEQAGQKLKSEAYGMTSSMNLLINNGVSPEWDDTIGAYYGEYKKDETTYKLWLEEEDSIESKMKLINKYDLAGVACWKLGLEKSSVWDVIIKYTNLK